MHSAYSSGLFSQCMKSTGLFCLCNYIQIAYSIHMDSQGFAENTQADSYLG
jgi:hypothetical protein